MSLQSPPYQQSKNGWIISPSDIMSQLTTNDKKALLAITELQEYKKNDFIFQSGMATENMFILQEGSVKIFEQSSTGKEVILWFCCTGELFGLAEISQGRTRAVSAQVVSDSSILNIKREAFNLYLRNHPDVALLVIDLLSRRLRGLSDMLMNLSCDDVESRLTKLLVRLCMRFGKRNDNGEVFIDLQLTHQEVADMIGTSRQTVSSTISKLKRDNVLEIINHCIYIRSPKLLACISDSLKTNY